MLEVERVVVVENKAPEMAKSRTTKGERMERFVSAVGGGWIVVASSLPFESAVTATTRIVTRRSSAASRTA